MRWKMLLQVKSFKILLKRLKIGGDINGENL